MISFFRGGKMKEKHEADRDKIVVKANELIQQSRFSLSVQQQKIVLYLISQIQAWDDDFKLYEFNIIDFCKMCGIDYDNGKNYANLKDAVKIIADKSLWVTLENGRETLLRWIEKPYIDKNNGTIQIRLDKDMKPFLLQLKKNFTRYELFWTLSFKSKYTIRLYELIKSVHYKENEIYIKEFDLKELKRMMGAEHYKTYQHFKERALLPAIAEINGYSDKNIEYDIIKRGRAISGIRFTISTKETMERIRLSSEIEKELGLNQMTLWDYLIEAEKKV